MGNCEIDPNAPLTPCERVCIGLLILAALACLAACMEAFW